MKNGRLMAAVLAQILAQALTAWTILAHVAGYPDVSIWAIAFLLAAGLAPFRHDGSLKDRAVGNFAAGSLLAGSAWWEVVLGGLDPILGGHGPGLGPEALLLLTSTVLFAVSGAMFWVLREE